MEPFSWGPLLKEGPLFIGILNVTPDSFSDGGRFQSTDAAVTQARRLLNQGAGMLDIGAESTRPGAASVTPEAEWDRLEPILRVLRDTFPATPLSLDTRHPTTAESGLKAGVAVLNDVTGFSDPAMLNLARTTSCGLIAMRSRVRQGGLWMPPYDGPAEGAPIEELRALGDRLAEAGINPDSILLDPGFGFGTTFAGDRALWESLPSLAKRLSWPIDRFCLGISRKRFLAWRANTPELPSNERDALTAEAHQQAMAMGFRIFRTHSIGPGTTVSVSPPPRTL